MKLRKIMALMVAVSVSASLTACGGSSASTNTSADTKAEKESGEAQAAETPSADAVVLTYAEVNPNESLDGRVGAFFKDKVAELSNGSVVIDIQASGVLGAENDVLDNMTTGGGTVDMARISCFALTNYGAKLSALPSIPFTFNDREHYWNFTETEIGQQILDEPAALGLGIKGLYFMEEGFRDFFLKETIDGIEGMKGKKIRVSSDPILTAVVEQLGANPTVVSFSELYSSLQSGVVDGADQPVALYESNAFNEVAPCLVRDGHTMSASEVIITEEAWNQLSDEQKAAVEEAGKLTSEYCKEQSQKIEDECIARLTEKGVSFVEVTDKTPWQEACKDVIAQYTEGLETEYQQILDAAK